SFADSIAAGGANASENGSNLSNLPSNADNTYGYDAKVEEIPVIGRIAAGTPILAEQNVEDSIPVPSRFLGNGRNFMLVVKGESMIEAGIMDGDYILVEEQSNARN